VSTGWDYFCRGSWPKRKLTQQNPRWIRNPHHSTKSQMGVTAIAGSVSAEPCVSCGRHCKQCVVESVVEARQPIAGCTACSGACVPRMMWVGRKNSVTVHTVGSGAAHGEVWHYNAGASLWEIGLRTSLPTNAKRNRFQWMEGHKVRPPASSNTSCNYIHPFTHARYALPCSPARDAAR